MSRDLPTPPVPDLARAEGETVSEVARWFVDFYNRGGAPFNYRSGTRAVRSAYKGVHKLHLLTAACAGERTAVGRSANRDVVNHAAPFAFGRNLQVFDLSRRRFAFGRDRFAAYRIPFFFVENGVVYVYYLQPRKHAGLNLDQLGMVATIMKTYLLESEFFGSHCDVEFVDVSAPPSSKARLAQKFSLETLPLWSERRLTDRLTIVSGALDLVAASGQVVRRRRSRPSPDPEMPLFD
jgi:hypothetical protein